MHPGQGLTLSCCRVGDSLPELAGMTRLRRLTIQSCHEVVGGDGLAALIRLCTRLPALQRVCVGDVAGRDYPLGWQATANELRAALEGAGNASAAVDIEGVF